MLLDGLCKYIYIGGGFEIGAIWQVINILLNLLYPLSERNTVLTTYWGEYRDLRALLHDKLFLEEFGQCGGMGRCATCLVEVRSSENSLAILQRNEETTLVRTGQNNQNIRLSCQIAVDDDISNAYIQLLENY